MESIGIVIFTLATAVLVCLFINKRRRAERAAHEKAFQMVETYAVRSSGVQASLDALELNATRAVADLKSSCLSKENAEPYRIAKQALSELRTRTLPELKRRFQGMQLPIEKGVVPSQQHMERLVEFRDKLPARDLPQTIVRDAIIRRREELLNEAAELLQQLDVSSNDLASAVEDYHSCDDTLSEACACFGREPLAGLLKEVSDFTNTFKRNAGAISVLRTELDDVMESLRLQHPLPLALQQVRAKFVALRAEIGKMSSLRSRIEERVGSLRAEREQALTRALGAMPPERSL